MKKIFFLAALALLFACKKQENVLKPATSVDLAPAELTLITGQTASLKATVLPEDTTDKLEWSSDKEDVVQVKGGELTAIAVGEATITAKAGDKTATCLVSVEGKMVAVDLGLSVKWAACNLGAENPEDYGDYYAWGELEPKDTYSWSTYKFGNSESGPFSKYNATDKKTVLDPEDDVAHVKLGGKWRMPTQEEVYELTMQCDPLWTTQNGKTGMLLTNNGNSIFIPAAGELEGTSINWKDEGARFWMSSLISIPESYIYSGWVDYQDAYDQAPRYVGLPIRAVRE